MNKFLKSMSIAAVAVLAISFQTSAQTVEEGLKHLDAEQYNAAGKIFKQLAQAAPSAESYFNLGYYYLRLEEPKLDSAKIAFEKGASLDPKKPDPLCRVGLGAVKLASKDRGGAKFDFDAVVKDTKSKNPDVLFRIAEAYTLFETNDPAEAVRYIELAQVKKKDAAQYLVLANAYLLKNDGGPAMTNLETALPTAKNPAAVKALMGKVWVQGKNYQKALDYYLDAIKTDPNYAPVYKQLGNFNVLYGKYDMAAKHFSKYLELADADDEAKLRYVKLAFTAKDPQNAIRVLDEIKGRMKDPLKYRLEGIADFDLGKPELAIPLLDKWIQEAGKDKEGKDRVFGLDYGFKGRSYAALKDVDKKKMNDSLAIWNMNKAIEMNDTTYNYYPDIAKIQAANKDYKGAIATYKKMIANSKKENMADYTALGQYLYIDGRNSKDTVTLGESEKIWSKVSDVYKEKYPIAYYYVGNSRRAIEGTTPTGKAVPAMENFIKAAWTDKDKNKRSLIDACNYVANISMLISKDLPKAAEYYKKTLEIDPANAEAIQGLATATGTASPVATPNGASPAATPIKN